MLVSYPLLLQNSRGSRSELTDIPLLQKRQRIEIWPISVIIEYICIALIVYIWAGEELYRCPDYACNEQDEQDKREQHHQPREQFALGNVYDFDDDEDDGERADGDAVGHDPVG